ncbi:hypothetical protein PAHAL_2G012500 [Panicum hallii]|uniref:Uncharacterized protein n=1 Tax=Panicum hallii TaxID=206008 RepID=A0A2T8KMF2_9POAL|nr:hypothetical protein PAHAL_2G012500 [Panicum hallii]
MPVKWHTAALAPPPRPSVGPPPSIPRSPPPNPRAQTQLPASCARPPEMLPRQAGSAASARWPATARDSNRRCWPLRSLRGRRRAWPRHRVTRRPAPLVDARQESAARIYPAPAYT